jgi:hypothetical protein
VAQSHNNERMIGQDQPWPKHAPLGPLVYLFTLNSYTFTFESLTCNCLISNVTILHFSFARFVICTPNWQDTKLALPSQALFELVILHLAWFYTKSCGALLVLLGRKNIGFFFCPTCYICYVVSHQFQTHHFLGERKDAYYQHIFLALSKNIVNFLLNLKLRSNYSNLATKQCHSMQCATFMLKHCMLGQI